MSLLNSPQDYFQQEEQIRQATDDSLFEASNGPEKKVDERNDSSPEIKVGQCNIPLNNKFQ